MKHERLSRNPARTRDHLVAAAFAEMYRCGYRGADLNSILGRAGVTKGALYHHFDSKDGLGHAVIEQAIAAITTGCEVRTRTE